MDGLKPIRPDVGELPLFLFVPPVPSENPDDSENRCDDKFSNGLRDDLDQSKCQEDKKGSANPRGQR